VRSEYSAPCHTGTVSNGDGPVPGEAPAWRPGEWKRRYVANVARLNSGEPDQISEVVTALTDRDERYGLSQGERRMLNRAVAMLAEGTGDDA
jgi:RNA polymerase-interacting CarD/CdnL/TRCF family regulator